VAPSEDFHEGAIQPPFRGNPDRDVFAMPTAAGHGYRVIVRAGTLPQVDVRLLDASGNPVRSRPVQAQDGTHLEFVSTEEAPRFISVAAPEGSSASGTYTYRLEDLGRDAHGDTLATATPLAVTNTPFPLALEFEGDEDVFTFRTESNQGFLFSCEGTDVSLVLMDGAGATVDGASQWDSSRRGVSQLGLEASTWFVRVYSSTDEVLAAHCQLEDLGRDDHANEPQGATPLTPSVSVAGRLHGLNDVDVFSFFATSGHTYELQVSPSRAWRFRLTDADGKTLAEPSWNRILHEATTTGTYYVQVLPDVSGVRDFEMKWDDLGRDDHGGTPETATPAEVGETITGVIHTETDVDAIAVPLDVDGVYRLTCTPDCSLATRLASTYVILQKVEPGVWNVLAPFSGLATFFVSSGSTPDAFTFRMEQVGTDDHGDVADHATPQSVPVNATGVFEVPSDSDFLVFPLEAGRTYVLDSNAATFSIIDPERYQVYVEYGEAGARYFTARLSGTYVAALTSARPDLNQAVPWTFFLREQ